MAPPRGKIGRLPASLRDEINGLIHDNNPADEIIALLESKGVAGVTPQNVSAWKKWGYDRWAKTQERLDGMAQKRAFSRQLIADAREEGGDALAEASDAASAMAVDAIVDVLEDFDTSSLKLMLATDPSKFADLVNSLSKIRARDQAAVLLRQKCEEYERKIKQLRDLVDDVGSADAEDVKKIFKEAYGI